MQGCKEAVGRTTWCLDIRDEHLDIGDEHLDIGDESDARPLYFSSLFLCTQLKLHWM